MRQRTKENNETENPKQRTEANTALLFRRRLMITVGLIACGFCLLTLKLFYLSVVRYEYYSDYASGQQLRDILIPAERGTIYDTNMNVLAQSAPASIVGVNPQKISPENYDLVARGLSEILQLDYQEMYDVCGESSEYHRIKGEVDQPIVEELQAYMSEHGIQEGIQYDTDSKRYYPYGAFAAQVLGFVGTDDYGLYGLELYYNDYLSGTPGRQYTAINVNGEAIHYDDGVQYDPIPGHSLVLTIDDYVQYYLEKHLEAAYAEHHVGNGACAIVMDVNTGAILGMATAGDFDPNDPLTVYDEGAREEVMGLQGTDMYEAALLRAQENQWRNKAISDLYEPGSVFKVITASAALETGACTLESTFYCSGSVEVADRIIGCAYAPGHGSENFLEAIINSCNPAFIDIAQRIGSSDFYRYFESFGFTQPTGIDLPGEAQSQYYSQSGLGSVELASSSFGQSNSITALQMVTAVSAVVNGGYLVQPYLVRQVLDEQGNVVENIEPTIKHQVISKETSDLMRFVMESVVENANGQNAYVAGFRIGGKSGTSEKLSTEEKDYWASFCAMAPADDPQIAVIVVLDDARSPLSIYGAVLAAPVTGAFMADTLPYLGVDAVYSDSELELVDIPIPHVESLTLSAVYAELNKRGFTYQIFGDGTTIVAQYPPAGQPAPPGSVVILYTEAAEPRTVEVPDLSGYTISAARSLLRSMGLNLKVEGANTSSSLAAAQSIAAGSVVPMGSIVTVDFYNQLND